MKFLITTLASVFLIACAMTGALVIGIGLGCFMALGDIVVRFSH